RVCAALQQCCQKEISRRQRQRVPGQGRFLALIHLEQGQKEKCGVDQRKQHQGYGLSLMPAGALERRDQRNRGKNNREETGKKDRERALTEGEKPVIPAGVQNDSADQASPHQPPPGLVLAITSMARSSRAT